MPDEKLREEISGRLRNVKGHIAGIERMIEEQAPCKDVLMQLSAVRSSIEKIGIYILENNAVECLLQTNDNSTVEKAKVEQVIKEMVSFLK